MFILVTEGLISSFSFILIFNLSLKENEDGDGRVAPPISVKSDDRILCWLEVRAIPDSATVLSVRWQPRRRNYMTL